MAAQFIARALELARRGRGAVEPNPMVGAIIVRESDDKILGEGFHGSFGGPHAEIEALTAARSAGADVRGSTMYVSLEPCSHHGKTPPCAEAIISAGIGRVVVAMQDPDEKVAGEGLKMLRRAGLIVDLGLGESDARQLLGPYIKLRTQARPWVICKWAQTLDGAIALPSEAGRWISCDASRSRVHELRSYCDGILVGAGTVLADDPLLTNRSENQSRQPVRVVLDSHLAMPPASQLVRTAAESLVIIATTPAGLQASPAKVEALRLAKVELLELPAGRAGTGVDMEALLDELGGRQWTYLLVEGGAKVLASFVETGLADELRVFVSPQAAGQAGLARFDIADVIKQGKYAETESETVGEDTLRTFQPVGHATSCIT